MADTNKEQIQIGPEKIIEKKRDYLMPCSYHFYKRPPQLVSAKGCRIWDSEGKEYIDFFAGVSVMACGHCNQEILGPVIEQMQTLQHTTSIYLTQPVVDLAEKLAAVLPGDLQCSFFCNSGTEANEGAMLLARSFTGRRGFISLRGGLHGRSYLTSAATGIDMWRTDPFVGDAPVEIVSGRAELVELLRQRGEEFAAIILEPLQGNGGICPLPADFFDEIESLRKEKGVLLISDEIQSGFGRTGRMFAIEHYPAEADIITGAKALGNGVPIGFFASGKSLAASFTRPSASTLGGNPVSCRAGIEVLSFIERHQLVQRAGEAGARLRRGLERLSRRYGCFGEVRGLGLMLGLETRSFGGQSAPELCDLILEEMKGRGFLIGKNGLDRNVLAFQPPLIISDGQIDALLSELDVVARSLTE